MLRQIAFGLAVGAVAYSLDALVRRKCPCRCAGADRAGHAARRQYKVVDLSYSPDPRQHLKDVAAYHELDGWRLLTVVHAEARWLYYLERDAAAEPGRPGGVVAVAVGREQRLPRPVRRVEGSNAGDVVTAGADVTAEGVSVEVRRWPAPGAGAGPS